MDKLKDALARDTGVNLIFLNMSSAFSLTYSDEQGKEIKCIAFNKAGMRVDTHMRGYNGPWSHVEIAMPVSSAKKIKSFLDKLDNLQLRLGIEEPP